MTPSLRLCLATGICVVGMVSALRLPQPSAAHDRTYVVQAYDTLSSIALRVHSRQIDLIQLNNIADPDHLRVGQVLILPADADMREGTGYPPRDRPAGTMPPGTYRVQPNSYQQAAPTYATPVTPYAGLRTGATYIVRPGDTLGALSSRFGVSIAALANANGIRRPEMLRVGQSIVIPARVTQAGYTASGQVSSGPAPAMSTPVSSTTAPPAASNNSVTASAGTSASGSQVGALLTSTAQTYGIDPALVKAVAWQESGWQMVTARDGGIGVMQLMPATAAWVGPALLGRTIDPYNLTDNIQAGVALLASYVRHYGDVRSALIAYNAGPGAVNRGAGSSTSQYVANVLALRANYAQ